MVSQRQMPRLGKPFDVRSASIQLALSRGCRPSRLQVGCVSRAVFPGVLLKLGCTQSRCLPESLYAAMQQAKHSGLCCPPQFYVKPRLGALFNAAKAAKLQAMLESSIQRRFPRGLKVHVHSVDRFGCLAQLTRTLKDAGLSITRAKASALSSVSPIFLPFPPSLASYARELQADQSVCCRPPADHPL